MSGYDSTGPYFHDSCPPPAQIVDRHSSSTGGVPNEFGTAIDSPGLGLSNEPLFAFAP